jgi:MFS family permease
MATMIFWGRASDYFGRKPTLIVSLIGSAFTISLFGFSKTVWQMVMFRCLAGIFSGTIVTIRTMITENSTKKTQAQAFSYFAFTGNMGILLGPMIGGGLSKLPEHYEFWRGNKFMTDLPYALPTLVCGTFAAIAAIASAVLIKETLNRNEVDKKGNKIEPMGTWELVKCRGVPFVLYLYSIVGLLAFAYTAVVPVFWFEPPELGGFGFDERQISLFISLAGASQAFWLLFIFPPLQRRIGTGGVLRLCSRAYPFFFLFNPLCNWLRRQGLNAAFWALGPPILMIGSGVAMNFTAVQLALNDISPSAHTLGTLNALALTLSSGIRAVSPALFTTLYAAGVKYQILWGQFIWLILIIITLCLAFSLRWLPEEVLHDMPNRNERPDEEGVENGNGEDADRDDETEGLLRRESRLDTVE